MKNVKKAVEIAEYKYPSNKYNILWVFDQSSGHHAYGDEALVAARMNVGHQYTDERLTKTRPGRLPDGSPQSMQLPNGKPKGMKMILMERGVDTRGMKRDDMRRRLQQFDDFK